MDEKIKVGVKVKLENGLSVEAFIYVPLDEIDEFLERVKKDEEAFLKEIFEKHNKGLEDEK